MRNTLSLLDYNDRFAPYASGELADLMRLAGSLAILTSAEKRIAPIAEPTAPLYAIAEPTAPPSISEPTR